MKKNTKVTLEQVEEKIEDLRMEVDAMKSNPMLREGYAEKVKELMYWKNRRIRFGRKAG